MTQRADAIRAPIQGVLDTVLDPEVPAVSVRYTHRRNPAVVMPVTPTPFTVEPTTIVFGDATTCGIVGNADGNATHTEVGVFATGAIRATPACVSRPGMIASSFALVATSPSVNV